MRYFECNKCFIFRGTWFIFPLTNELASTGLQHSCISIIESATHMLKLPCRDSYRNFGLGGEIKCMLGGGGGSL